MGHLWVATEIIIIILTENQKSKIQNPNQDYWISAKIHYQFVDDIISLLGHFISKLGHFKLYIS